MSQDVQEDAMPHPLKGRLVIVRHGQTDWNKAGRMQGSTDIELNDLGREQAREAAVELRGFSREGESWEVLAASPLSRAEETAHIIGLELGISQVLTVPGVIERSFGEAEGKVLTYEQSRHPEQRYTGVEPEAEVYRRGIMALQELVREYPGRNIVVVSHGSLIRRVLKATTPGDWTAAIPNARPLEVDLEGLLGWDPSTPDAVMGGQGSGR